MEVMAYDEVDEVINKFFASILSRYQIWLETSMRVNNFIFALQMSINKFHNFNKFHL